MRLPTLPRLLALPRLAAVFCLPALLTSPLALSAARVPLSPADDEQSLQVSEPQTSPDGAWVAYVVTSIDHDADGRRSAIWMVSWDGTQDLALTAPAAGTHAPRFSPDGRYLS